MCRSRAEGGQRCASHVRALLEKATERYEGVVLAAQVGRVLPDGTLPLPVQSRGVVAEGALADAMAQYASTMEGHQELLSRLSRPPNATDDHSVATPERTVLQVALTQGEQLRVRAEHVRAAVRRGDMTPAQAKEVTQFPTVTTDHFRKSGMWPTGRTITGLQDKVRDGELQARYARDAEKLGAAEHAYRWRQAEEHLGAGRPWALAEAENNLFDTRVTYIGNGGDRAADELETQLAGMPGNEPAVVHDRQVLNAAIMEGRRHADRVRDLDSQYAQHLISEGEYNERLVYPSDDVFMERQRLMFKQFGLAPIGTRRTQGRTERWNTGPDADWDF